MTITCQIPKCHFTPLFRNICPMQGRAGNDVMYLTRFSLLCESKHELQVIQCFHQNLLALK